MSSLKDEFLDKLSNLDENLQYSYLNCIEKYIITSKEEVVAKKVMLEVIEEEEEYKKNEDDNGVETQVK